MGTDEVPPEGLAERREAVRRAREAAELRKQGWRRRRPTTRRWRASRGCCGRRGIGLDDVVIEALRLIGFEVSRPRSAGTRVEVRRRSRLFEIEASEHPIDMAPHHRLRQRIERAIDKRARRLAGVLFVNGQRLQPPSQREHVSDSLRLAAETMRYCLAPTPGLYEAVVAKLNGDEEVVAEYRRCIVATDGLLS